MIEHSLYVDENYALISVSGNNTLDDFIQATTAFCADPAYDKRLHRICDFTEADLSSLGMLDVVRYIRHSRIIPIAATSKVALVGGAQRTILLMFLNAVTKFEVRHFLDIEVAMDWVGQQPSSASKLPTNEFFVGAKVHLVSGNFSMEAAQTLQVAWFQDEDFDPTLPVVWDLRNAEFTSSMPEVEDGAEDMYAQKRERRPAGKAAILVKSKQHEIIIRHAFRDRIQSGETSVFLSEVAVSEWLSQLSQSKSETLVT